MDINVETRYERYLTRNKSIDKFLSKEGFLIVDNHSVELEIESLKNGCNLVIGTESIADSLKKINEMVEAIGLK